MANQRLIPEPPDTDKSGPKGRFSEVATKVFSVPKREIDKRDDEWKTHRTDRKTATT